jgi:hypothetical protein
MLWDTEVAPMLNNTDSCPMRQLCGVLSGVGSSLPPARPRSGERLKSVLFRSKKTFSCAYRKWELPDQMDAECESFKSFLPRVATSSAELSQDAKRAAILFQALKCGTDREDTPALDFTLKLARPGVGYDEGEEETDNIPLYYRKRRRDSSLSSVIDMTEVARTLAEPLKTISASIASKSGAENRRGPSPRASSFSNKLQEVKDRREMIEAFMTAKRHMLP